MFRVSHLVKLWKWTAYHKIVQNFVENGGRIFTQSLNYLHANFFQNNAKCTYFHPKMYLRRQKMYLVNNVLENRIRAVPLLNIFKVFGRSQMRGWLMITPALEWALTKHSCGSHLVMCCSCCSAALGSAQLTQNVWGNPSYFLSRTGYYKAHAKVTRRQNKALESRIGNYIGHFRLC